MSYLLALAAIVFLAGCASEPTAQVCYLRFMGKTDQGFTVVIQACVSPEAYAEAQK